MGTAEAIFWIVACLYGIAFVVSGGFLLRKWWRSGRTVDMGSALSPTMIAARMTKKPPTKNRIVVNDDRAGVRAEKKEREKHDL